MLLILFNTYNQLYYCGYTKHILIEPKNSGIREKLRANLQLHVASITQPASFFDTNSAKSRLDGLVMNHVNTAGSKVIFFALQPHGRKNGWPSSNLPKCQVNFVIRHLVDALMHLFTFQPRNGPR